MELDNPTQMEIQLKINSSLRAREAWARVGGETLTRGFSSCRHNAVKIIVIGQAIKQRLKL